MNSSIENVKVGAVPTDKVATGQAGHSHQQGQVCNICQLANQRSEEKKERRSEKNEGQHLHSHKDDAVKVTLTDIEQHSEVGPNGSIQYKNSEIEMTSAEKRRMKKLKARDKEIRAHEHAHLSGLGTHKVGGASFTYEIGPDGQYYAVHGSVNVDLNPSGTAEETVDKMKAIQKGALAPLQPSYSDRIVARIAKSLEISAAQEIRSDERKEQSKKPEQTIASRRYEKFENQKLAEGEKLERVELAIVA